MSPVGELLHAHAAALTELELRRRGSAIAALPAERSALVAAEAERIAAELAEGVLEHARTSPAVASALASIYGAGGHAPVVESVLGTAE